MLSNCAQFTVCRGIEGRLWEQSLPRLQPQLLLYTECKCKSLNTSAQTLVLHSAAVNALCIISSAIVRICVVGGCGGMALLFLPFRRRGAAG